MKKPDFIKNLDSKTVIGVAGAVVAAVVTFVGSMSDQKRDKEFEEMKKSIAELKKN